MHTTHAAALQRQHRHQQCLSSFVGSERGMYPEPSGTTALRSGSLGQPHLDGHLRGGATEKVEAELLGGNHERHVIRGGRLVLAGPVRLLLCGPMIGLIRLDQSGLAWGCPSNPSCQCPPGCPLWRTWNHIVADGKRTHPFLDDHCRLLPLPRPIHQAVVIKVEAPLLWTCSSSSRSQQVRAGSTLRERGPSPGSRFLVFLLASILATMAATFTPLRSMKARWTCGQ